MEAALTIYLDNKNKEIIKNIDLSELCITSSVTIKDGSLEDIKVETTKAKGEKCPVCWKISTKPCERHNNLQ